MAANFASGHVVGGTARRVCCEFAAPRPRATACAAIGCALTVFLLAGCYQRPVLPESEGHITTPAAKPTLADIPPPARVSSFLPEPKPAIKAPTYSVVVNEVPVKELLLALARDTRQNIDIHPGLQGLVSLNAINETLPAILDRLAKQVNLRYRQEGNTLAVTPDTAYLKTYKINYVNMTRDTTSTIGVSGQIAGPGGGAAAGGAPAGGAAPGGGGAAGANASQTSVQTRSKSGDFWDVMRDNIRAILNSTRQQTQTAEARAERAESIRQEQEFKIRQMEAASRAGAGAPGLANAVNASGSPLLQVTLLPDDVAVNPVAGTVSVLATEKQHALIQEYIDKVTSAVQRQVLIEATIVEVRLSDRYRAGVDWSKVAVSGAITFDQSLLAGNLGTPPSFTVGYANPNSVLGNVAAAIRLLEQFGNTRVLSSPKLMAMNNQTALLKVVDNLVYFSIEASTATTQGAQTQTFNTTAHTVPVGVIMSLTPQINENGQVTLNVRPTISRILSFANDPNPSLCSADILKTFAKCLTNPVPQVQTREMESVLQVGSGQTVILGGLMQDDIGRSRDAVPGLGNLPSVGDLFAYRDDNLQKTELVIFLRPTVITNPSLESDELKFYQRFLPQQTGTPATTIPGEKTGAAK
jgi:general secretion pathway protein D